VKQGEEKRQLPNGMLDFTNLNADIRIYAKDVMGANTLGDWKQMSDIVKKYQEDKKALVIAYSTVADVGVSCDRPISQIFCDLRKSGSMVDSMGPTARNLSQALGRFRHPVSKEVYVCMDTYNGTSQLDIQNRLSYKSHHYYLSYMLSNREYVQGKLDLYAGVIMDVQDGKNVISPTSLTTLAAHVIQERNRHFAIYFKYVTAGQGYTFERRETTRNKKTIQLISKSKKNISKQIKDAEKTLYETGYEFAVEMWAKLKQNKREFHNEISSKKGILSTHSNPPPTLSVQIESMIAINKYLEDGNPNVKVNKEKFITAIKNNRQIINSSYFIRFDSDRMETRLVHDITRREYIDLHIERFKLYDTVTSLIKIMGYFNRDNAQLLRQGGESHKFQISELDGKFVCDLYEKCKSLPRNSRKGPLTSYRQRAVKFLKYTMNNIFGGDLASKQRRISGSRIREYYFKLDSDIRALADSSDRFIDYVPKFTEITDEIDSRKRVIAESTGNQISFVRRDNGICADLSNPKACNLKECWPT